MDNRGLINKDKATKGVIVTSSIIIVGYTVVKVIAFLVEKFSTLFPAK